MIKIIKNSLAFRSGSFYKFFCKRLPILSKTAKQQEDVFLMMLTGKNQISMLRECLLSVYNSNTSLPRLLIVSDGTISVEKIVDKLRWWNNSIEVITKEQILNYHLRLGRSKLVKFATENPMGLKLAALLYDFKGLPILYCDTDILWFMDLKLLIKPFNEIPSYLVMSEDYQQAYDLRLKSKNEYLLPPYYCAGLLLIKGEFYDSFLMMRELVETASNKSNHFSEQTIFAFLNKENFRLSWDTNQIACFQSDQFSLLPTYKNKEWIARHYVGPVRHLFWRDAFFLRIRKKKND